MQFGINKHESIFQRPTKVHEPVANQNWVIFSCILLILLFHLHFVILLLHPCTQRKIKGIVSLVKLENFRHSFFILSFQPPIWYSFKLLSLPKTWDKADKDRNDRTIYNAEIFLVSIVFVDYGLSIGITIHVLLVYFSFLPPTTLLLLLL